MLEELIRIASRLDYLGLSKEADILDSEILKIAASDPGSLSTLLKALSEENLRGYLILTPYQMWEKLNKENPEEKLIFENPAGYYPDYEKHIGKKGKELLEALQADIKKLDERTQEFEEVWEESELRREKQRIEREEAKKFDKKVMERFVNPAYQTISEGLEYAEKIREEQAEAARSRSQQSQEEIARSIMEASGGMFTRANLERLYGMGDYERWVELTKGPQEVFLAIMRKNLDEIVEDEKPKPSSQTLNELLVGIRRAWREDNNKRKTEFEQKYRRGGASPDISAGNSGSSAERSPSLSEVAAPQEDRAALYGGFQKADSRARMRIFLEAPNANKEELIIDMNPGQLGTFWMESITSTDNSLNKFKAELSKPWFSPRLKMIFAKKLVRYALEVLGGKEESKKELTKFWKLLSPEDKASLREATLGGGSSTFEADRKNKSLTVMHPPAEISEEGVIRPSRFRKTKEREGLDEKSSEEPVSSETRSRKNIRAINSESKPYEVMGSVDSVGEIEATDSCIFQLVPVNPGLVNSRTIWILKALFRPNFDHADFQENPLNTLNTMNGDAQEISDELESSFKEEYSSKGNMAKYFGQTGDEGLPGDCIVVDGDEALELIRSGIAKIRLEAWSGSKVNMPTEEGPSSGGSSVGKNKSESLYESDPSAKKREDLPSVFRPKKENIDPNLGTITVDPKTGEIPTMGGSPSRPKSKGKKK